MQIVRKLSALSKGVSAGSAISVSLLTATTVAAFLLRYQGLGDHSLWVDEAMSVVFAAKPVPELLRLLVTDDIHPPLYPLLLHFWMAVAGSSEAAARFPSLVFGVMLVPLIYATGQRLEAMVEKKRRWSISLVGLVSALIVTPSAFYIGYSQAARNYMAVTFMGLLSSYLLLLSLSNGGRKRWIAYAVATALALYTHYTAFLLLPFHLLFVVFTCRVYKRAWRGWGLAIVGVAASYLPWIGYSAEQLQRISDFWPGTLEVESALRTTLLLFVAGGGAGQQQSILPLLFGIALLSVGFLALLVGAFRGSSARHLIFLLLYLIVPTALLLTVAYYRPKFDPRYLLLVTPAFYLMLAWGIASLLQLVTSTSAPLAIRVGLPLLGIAALSGTIGVSVVYGEPAKLMHVGDGRAGIQEYGDYRSLVAYIEEHSQPDDAVVLMMNSYHPYVYYSKLRIPWYPMEPFDDFDGAIIRLNRMAEAHNRLWFILWQKQWADPADYVMHVMDTQAREVPLDASFGGIGLRLFELVPGKRFSYYPEVENKKEALFGGRILEFWGWNCSADSVVPGGSVQLDLHWRSLQKTDAKLKTKLMLADAELHLWAVVDEATVSPLYPSSQWKEQDILHDRHTLNVPVGVPPGSYQLLLLLYDERTMQDLPIEKWSGESLGTLLSLGNLTVKPTPDDAYPPASQPPIATWYVGSGRVDLLRSTVSRLVSKPGERSEVALLWRIPEPVKSNLNLRLTLLDEKGNPVGEQVLPLTPDYPPASWHPGEPILSRHWVNLPSDLPTGRYGVAAAIVDAQGQQAKAFQYHQLSTLDVVPLEQEIWPDAGQERVAPIPTPAPPLSPERALLRDIINQLGLSD
ncbi:MAG: glycosyltransferase family 39 protein [Chloroflexota bacterium]